MGRGDLVVDIGAGSGVITAELLAVGARVLAVELHPRRAAQLRAKFADEPRLIVVGVDAATLRLPTRPFTVVANPPFAITTTLLRRLTHRRSALERAAIVLPAWAAVRWARAAAVRGRYELALGPTVPAHAFTPPPPNPTRVLLISR